MLEIFQYDFMMRALAAGLIVGTLAPAVGLFLVVRRFSLMADTLSHVSFFGIALASFTGWPPALTAMAICAMAGIAIAELKNKLQLFSESILSLFLSGTLSLAVIILSLPSLKNSAGSFNSILFGSIATVNTMDLWRIFLIGICLAVMIGLFFRQLFLFSLDENIAKAGGLKTRALNWMLMIMSAAAIGVSIQIVGVLLIGALLIIPVLSAMQWKKGFVATFWLSILLSITSVIAGLFASFYLNLPSGPAIVMAAIVLFCVSAFGGRGK